MKLREWVGKEEQDLDSPVTPTGPMASIHSVVITRRGHTENRTPIPVLTVVCHCPTTVKLSSTNVDLWRKQVEGSNDDFSRLSMAKTNPQWARVERKHETPDGLAKSISKVRCKRGCGETH